MLLNNNHFHQKSVRFLESESNQKQIGNNQHFVFNPEIIEEGKKKSKKDFDKEDKKSNKKRQKSVPDPVTDTNKGRHSKP